MPYQMTAKFFMRFYGRPEPEVWEWLNRFRVLFPQVKHIHMGILTQSVNAVVPADSWQAELYFENDDVRNEVKNNPIAKKMYTQFAYVGEGAKFKPVEPGDVTTKNPLKGVSINEKSLDDFHKFILMMAKAKVLKKKKGPFGKTGDLM